MVDVDNKVVNILPGCTTIIKKKCKEHYQMHSYQILKQLQKDANMIQDTLCQLQNVDLSGFDTTMPEFEIPKQQEFQAEQKRLLKE
jgi:formiminotetrahydrofolate cyclodeaminase